MIRPVPPRLRSAHRVRGALGVAALALAAGVLVAGCGGSAGASGSGSTSDKAYQARLSFAKCMRAQGINVPDPSANGGPPTGTGRPGGPGAALRNIPAAKRTAALKACGKYLQNAFGNVTPAQRAQIRQQAVKFAQCMRQHGVNVPDPTAAGPGGGGGFAIRRGLRSIDRNSPAFKAAMTACGSLAPRFGRGGPGGGGGPGGAGGGAAPAPAPAPAS